MAQRYRKMGEQLGKIISDAGAHMPHAMLGVKGVLRKRRSQKSETKLREVGGSRVDPRKEYNPHPYDFQASSM